jgi:hypothetical protein
MIALASLLAGGLVGMHAFAEDAKSNPPAESGNPQTLAALRARAQAGHAPSQAKLGDHYQSASDFTNAVVWYRKAAEQGEVKAQLSLASCYLAGQGVTKAPQEAARWLRAAALQIDNTSASVPSPPSVPKSASASPTPPAPPRANDPPSARFQRVWVVQAAPQQLLESPQPLQLQRASP